MCEQQMEVPSIIKRLSPNVLVIHPKQVEKGEAKYREEQREMILEIAYPMIKNKPAMSEPPGPAGTEFKYIPVQIKLPFVINRPSAPINFLGVHEGGKYVVKARHNWLEARCGIRRPVVWIISPIKHKKNLRSLASQYQEVFDQFRELGEAQTALSPPMQRLPIQLRDNCLSNLDNGLLLVLSMKEVKDSHLNRVVKKISEAFGHDFSGVRVHTSPEADTLNHQLNAKAFTTDQDILFTFYRATDKGPHIDIKHSMHVTH